MSPDDLAATQEGLVARWQMLDQLAMSADAARWWARDLRVVFPGVYVTGAGPVTETQLARAATLTAPGTWLARDHAAVSYGFRAPEPDRPVTVVRAGQGGPRVEVGLEIRDSLTLEGHVGVRHGTPITSPGRTVIDLWPILTRDSHRHRMVREAIRTQAVTPRQLLDVVRLLRGARGVATLRSFVSRYQHLPLARCRSDAEAFALTVLDDLGIRLPLVNSRQAGEEADFFWPDLRHVLEIDGPSFHLFADVDARKTAAWVAAGITVSRMRSPVLYDDPLSIVRHLPPGLSPG